LEDVVSVTIVHPIWRLTQEGTSDEQRGWVFGNPNAEPFNNTAGRGGPFPADFPGAESDPFFESFSIRDIYEKAGDTSSKFTIPLLWDKKENTIVNNESSDISYMLNSSFNEFSSNPDLDLYTEEDSEKLNDVIEMISPLMIHGVYRCGFAKKQSAYDKAVAELTNAFDQADLILQNQRFLTGSTLTDADIRLFVTLFRFDEIYAIYFRANSRLVTLTPALLNYCRDIYQMEGVAKTCSMEHCKAHFFCSHAEWNKFSIVPKGLGFLSLLEQPHDRDQFHDVTIAIVDEENDIDSEIS
jgi:glutathionyl-hydroquinone reductase